MMRRTRRVGAWLVAVVLAGAAAGSQRAVEPVAVAHPLPAPSEDRSAVAVAGAGAGAGAGESGAARCDSVLPVAGGARLPVLHRRDKGDADNFVATAIAFRGDTRVGPAAWWLSPLMAVDTITFAGPDRLIVAGQPYEKYTWSVGGVSVRDPAARWARESRAPMPTAGSFVRVPEPVVVGTTLVTAVPQQVHRDGTTRTVSLVCGIDAENGHIRWGTEVPLPAIASDDVSLLATGGTVVVKSSQDTGLVALTATDGRIRWHTTAGAPTTLTAAGGLLVLSPDYFPYDTPAFKEIRALDPGDGRVAWRHPVPTSAGRVEHRTVVATAAGQPVVVWEEGGAVAGSARPGKPQLVGYRADGSVRWKQPATSSPQLDAFGDLLIERADSDKPAPYRTTARRVTDGATTWRSSADLTPGQLAASGTRLFTGELDLRSIKVVDRRSGAVATSLAGVMLNVGKSGFTPGVQVAGRTLMVTVADTAVGFPLG